MSSYREVRKETAEKMAGDASQELLPCRYCATATQRGTLSALGARCVSCYRNYCTAVQTTPTRKLTLEEKKAALMAIQRKETA